MFAIEQQTKSGLGHLQWLRVAGPFPTEAEAERFKHRLDRRGLPLRIVKVR